MANLLNQHFTMNSSRTLGKAKTITRPSLISDFPVLNESSININQIRRSGQSHPYEYKPSVNTKQIPIATLYARELTSNAFDEEIQGTPIYIHRVHQQQSRGIRRSPRYISQLNALINHEDLDESAIQLDQLQRLGLAQPTRYKLLRSVRPSIGIIRQTPSVSIEEELSEEPLMNINRLRPLSATTRQKQVVAIIRPSISTNFDPTDETAFNLNRFHRPLAPQNIHYKAPIGLQPSTGSIIKNNSTLTEENLFTEASLILNQLRQRHAQILKQQTTFV